MDSSQVIQRVTRHLVLVVICGIWALPAWAKGGKVLVQDLAARGVEVHEAASIATASCTALAQRKGYDVLCGDDLRAMIKWNTMAATFNNCADASCMSTTAKAMKARFVVSGSVAKVGDAFVLTLSMLDVKQGKTRGRAEVKADSLGSLYKQVPEAVDVLVGPGRK